MVQTKKIRCKICDRELLDGESKSVWICGFCFLKDIDLSWEKENVFDIKENENKQEELFK